MLGAVTNNTEGIASSSDNAVNIVAVQAQSAKAKATDIDHGLEAFSKAIEENVDMISVSWGAFGADFPLFKKIIQKGLDKGIIIVAAAGNYSSSEPFYPAAYDGVYAVASVGENGRKSWFTNYGSWVDLAAPGEKILATDLGGAYTNSEGTSQAAPIAAGAIAYGLAQGLTMEQIMAKLEPVTDTGIGKGIISMREYCACEISYPQLDYNEDGQLNDKDLNYIRSQYL
ncbi:MAG: S8 family serine peptidase [Candidatus Peribacteria bacterium]|nr:MAG: S8 family serine peptidase [Candidatus Peribacteria bacterium]